MRAVGSYVELRQRQGDFSGAVTVAEEAYNVFVIAYYCLQPQVQVAAGTLIARLIQKGDLFNSERFAQLFTYNIITLAPIK
jgi:hypothetical protein